VATTQHRGAPPAVEAGGLTKRFGRTLALTGIDLQIAAGIVYGILGPNGAGKTTTFRVLTTLLRPDEGWTRVLGHDVEADASAVRRAVSLTGQFASVDEDLTGRENLVLVGRLLGHSRRHARSRADELLEAFGLGDAATRSVGKFSGGMRRRLDIAASLIVTPEVAFLDERTTGLDPRSRNQVWDVIRAIVDRGTTVVLTTQYLDEADQLSDRIAVIDHGRVIAEGTPGELKAATGVGGIRVRLRHREQRDQALGVLSAALGVPAQAERDAAGLAAGSRPRTAIRVPGRPGH
jgi:ABC-2 type transport system ATP-binding protein